MVFHRYDQDKPNLGTVSKINRVARREHSVLYSSLIIREPDVVVPSVNVIYLCIVNVYYFKDDIAFANGFF